MTNFKMSELAKSTVKTSDRPRIVFLIYKNLVSYRPLLIKIRNQGKLWQWEQQGPDVWKSDHHPAGAGTYQGEVKRAPCQTQQPFWATVRC